MRAGALFGDDVDGEGDLDVGVQFHRDLCGAELLQRLGELRLAPVELDTGLGANRVDDVRRRHRSEEAAFLAGSGSDLDPLPGQLVGQRLRPFAIARVPGFTVAAHRFALLHDTLGRLDRQAARHEVVPRVAVGDLDEVALATDVLDVVAQHDLHDWSSPPAGAGAVASAAASAPSSAPFPTSAGALAPASSAPAVAALRSAGGSGMRSRSRSRSRSRRPPRLRCVTCRTLYGRSAISRAMRIARATARCCCALLPVTRRARILARSDMNRRSRLTSL